MNTKKLSVGVVFGGVSTEYEISLLSATSILNNMDASRYDVYMIGITKAGDFYLYNGEIDRIKDDQWQGGDCTPCVISPDRSHHGLLVLGDNISNIRLDCVFPVLHGKNGEDGTIQGLLEIAGLPYVGCGVASCANCMDKIITKTILDSVNINNSKWIGFTHSKYKNNQDYYCNKIVDELKFPCFVKPANAGSSVGITKAHNRNELLTAIDTAFRHDTKVLVEETILGKELECAVLGNSEPIVAVIGEIIPCNEFYDYDAKYLANRSESYIPARISTDLSDKIREVAKNAYIALECRGLSRVDFFLTDENKIILNEINTIPGFTSISMYPKLFEAYGLPYNQLIDKLISFAMEKF